MATLAVLFSCFFALASPPAHAGPRSRVVLVRPASPTPWTDEMITRAAGELGAAGFEPMIVDAAPGEDPQVALRRAAVGSAAAIAVTDADTRIWVDDRVAGSVAIGEPTRPASDVAIETVELLRASLIQLTVRSREPAATTATKPTSASASAEAARRRDDSDRSGLHLSVGPALFAGFDPGGVHVAPMFGVGLVSTLGLGGHIRFIGPGAGTEIDVPGGAVAWSPWVLAAGPTYEAALSKRWFLRGSVDVGLFHLSADGDLAAPAESRSGSTLDAVFMGGGAVGVAITEHVAVTLGVEALVTAPPPTVEVGGETVATAGRPWVVVPLGVEVTP